VVLEEISMVEDTPDDLVFELHNAAMWGDHPLGYSILGTRESVKSLGVRELRALHARAYHPSRIVVAASGSVDHDRLLEILHATGWNGREERNGKDGGRRIPATRAQKPSRKAVKRAGAQTHIVMGTPTLGYGDSRRHALVLLSVVLGGGMSSRLFQRIREELGLAYSVYTFQTFYAQCGVHGVYVGTGPKTARDALQAIEDELDKVATDGLAEAEIEQGKGQLKGQLTLSLESPTSRMYRAAAVELYGEPYRPLDEMLSLIDGIEAGTLHDLAREYFTPKAQTVLTLGAEASATKRRTRRRG
jgi:predicted Zn-dependent peptidase